MDWDNLPEVLEARYLAGLKVNSDQRLKGLNHFLLYGAGVLAIWAAMPKVRFYGWVPYAMWGASFLFLYWSFRGLAIIAASHEWRQRQ